MQTSVRWISSQHRSKNRPRHSRTCFLHLAVDWLPLSPISHRLVVCLTTDEEFKALCGSTKDLHSVAHTHTLAAYRSLCRTHTHADTDTLHSSAISDYVHRGTQIPDARSPWRIKFEWWRPIICGFSVWVFLHVTLMQRRIFRWILDFGKFMYTWCRLFVVTPCSLIGRYLVSDERSASFFRVEVNKLLGMWIFWEPDHRGSTEFNLCPGMKIAAGWSSLGE